MKNIGYGSLFILTVGILFIPMFFIVRHFESTNTFDSIGTWYTVYVTLVFTAAPALLACGVKWLKSRGEANG
nr:hypothetical protein 1 [Gammaproteobacteria bacterium]